MPQAATLRLLPLEDRTVPAHVAFGDGWADPRHLTVSFAPDGTAVGAPPPGGIDVQEIGGFALGTLGLAPLYYPVAPVTGLLDSVVGSLTAQPGERSQASAAFARLSGWQREVLRAFEAWASVTNIDLTLVPDSGAAFGSPGAEQGDSRFGDIRIGGVGLAPSALANAVAVSAANGTWSGDVLFNTNARFGVNGSGGYDLFTVALHEAGHVFGLEHSTDPASAMTENYKTARTGLAASDVATVQSYYGPRVSDAYDAAGANDTRGAATAVTANGFTLAADLSSATDADWYSFHATPAAPVTVRLTTADSLLAARLTITDTAGNVLGSAVSNDPTCGDLTVTVRGGSANDTYFVKVSGGTAAGFAVGGYQLSTTGPGSAVNVTPPPPLTTPFPLAPQHSSATTTSDAPVFASGTLTRSHATASGTFTMTDGGLFALGLDSTTSSYSVQLTTDVFDASGRKVLSVSQAANGRTTRGEAYLMPGTYTVRTTAVFPLLAYNPSAAFTLRASVESNPMGPYGTNRSAAPASPPPSSPPSPPPPPPTTGTTTSQTADKPYSY